MKAPSATKASSTPWTDGTSPAETMTDAEKKQKILSIDDEVRGLHPLLKQLLPKLPGINNVEYTHGTWERGADFLLEKYDATLDQTVYVALIAKLGNIKSDHSEIERQISECALERHYYGGTRKIVPNEIWVVTTGSISENAKEKIHHNYAAKSISFVSGDRLVALIDKAAPHFWLDLGLELGHYLGKLRMRMADLEQQSNLVQISGKPLYLESDLIEREAGIYDPKKTQKKKIKVNILTRVLDKRIIESSITHDTTRAKPASSMRR